MKRQTSSSSSKSSNKKTRFIFNIKSNTIMEDTENFNFRGKGFFNKIKIISDPKEPFFKETIKD